jgi:hypothetical protein
VDLIVTATGRVFYQVDPTLAALLIEAFPASFERKTLDKIAHTPLVPSWGVSQGQYSGRWHVIYKIGQRTEFYDAPPENLVAYFERMNIAVPEVIVKRFKELWKPVDVVNDPKSPFA